MVRWLVHAALLSVAVRSVKSSWRVSQPLPVCILFFSLLGHWWHQGVERRYTLRSWEAVQGVELWRAKQW